MNSAPMDEDDELADWLRLSLTDGVGPNTARELLSRFGLPEHIFGAGLPALQKCVPDKLALALSSAPSAAIAAHIDLSLQWARLPGNHVLTFADNAYPQALLTISDPPPVLYAKGRVELLSRPSLAIVGSRNATAQGAQNAERFAQALSHAGVSVMSGLALGIDAAAHLGALSAHVDHASTVAVTGTGLDLVYPAKHRELAHRIAADGCLISEYPLGTPAIAANFPRRNRLISGLSQGVLVVEAALQSGSLITARSALEQGREVFAIPGSIHSPLAKGCHQLIRQGAKLVESAQDILEELRWQARVQTSSPSANAASDATQLADDTAQLLNASGYDPVSVDELTDRTGWPLAAVQAKLLELEMQGQLEMLAGGLYRRLK